MNPRDVAFLTPAPPTAGAASFSREAHAHYAATDLEGPRQLTLGLVHEMNNLLGGITMLSETYQGASGTDAGFAEGLGLIHQGAGRLQSLVTHLKTLNGPATGEATYLNLCASVRAWFEMFAPLLPKTLAVVMAFPLEEMAVHVDEASLRHVLLNLALNLRDSLGDRPGTAQMLHVGLRPCSGSRVELTLSAATGDAGPAANARARLEDARQRLDQMGGTLIAHPHGEFILGLPRVV